MLYRPFKEVQKFVSSGRSKALIKSRNGRALRRHCSGSDQYALPTGSTGIFGIIYFTLLRARVILFYYLRLMQNHGRHILPPILVILGLSVNWQPG